ncbi:hydrolase [Marinobacter psychrophilus]|uniref:Hydrolase n=1 Tax=Marinobacter psychrophilus TaxID=330734 RepID=A0A0H4I502_9GAMM|nr:alpha/beta hydrolase [Marinobacter psychrophilus]AKO52810.1 hydrolase [Marinobacter psychrophilus]
MNGIAAVEGSGAQRVLVLHGWALDSKVWLDTRALIDHTRFTYAYFDFPGYGSNRSATLADGMEGMAASALAAAASLGWDHFDILGHSMGGATALRVATLAPERVSAVVALTPVSPQGTPLDEATYESFKSAWADPSPVLRGLAPHLTAEQLDNIVGYSRATMNQSVWEAYLENWTKADFFNTLKNCSTPVTLAYGDSDPFVTAEYLSNTASSLSSGTLVAIDNAGHYPMVENSRETVRLWESAFIQASKGVNNV